MRHICLIGVAFLVFLSGLGGSTWLVHGQAQESENHGHAVEHDGEHHDARSAETHDEHSEANTATPGTMIAAMLAAQCLLIVAASLAGGWLPKFVRLTHMRMQLMISFVGGLMLGIGLLHLLPHSVAQMQSLDRAALWMMVGTMTMFFLLRVFHFHQHEPSELARSHSHASGHTEAACHEHASTHEEPHSDAHDRGHSHELSWTGVALGLSLHTLIDGAALGASVQADAQHGLPVWMLGLGTFLAIVLHKPLDALSITALMAAGHWQWRSQQFVNFGFALMCPIGAALFVFGVSSLPDAQHLVVGCALAFAAGVFVCISMSDLLPELEFHAHDRLKLSTAILAGIVLAYLIGFIEPVHSHGIVG